jgi:hypothetical protein
MAYRPTSPDEPLPGAAKRPGASYHKARGQVIGGLRRQDLMSVDEIRWWLKELMERRGWGTRVLGRTMGLRNPQCVMAKADGRQWIYPRERIRMSHQLRRIISGELVCINGKPGRGNAGKAVIADYPQPLRLPIQWHINLKRKDPFEWREQTPPLPTLPNFRTLLENPRTWKNPWPGSDRPCRLKRLYLREGMSVTLL